MALGVAAAGIGVVTAGGVVVVALGVADAGIGSGAAGGVPVAAAGIAVGGAFTGVAVVGVVTAGVSFGCGAVLLAAGDVAPDGAEAFFFTGGGDAGC